LVAEAIDGKRPNQLTREHQGRLGQSYSETLNFYDQRRKQLPDPQLSDMDYESAALELEKCGVHGLGVLNGLSDDENRELFHTGSVDVAVYLTMKGLSAIAS
jgi:hypothetical protein